MTCREFERLIPDFLEKKMDYQTLEEFVEHMNNCDSCKEELSIQFLVTDGLRALEEDSLISLDDNLRKRLDDTRKDLNRYRLRLRILKDFIVFLMIILGIVYLWFLG